ncbi:MAG: SpoIIIAH-like family protein [Bacilli bacterium]
MINKKSLWFLTLFSLILVLSIYYITMPNELLLTNNSNYQNEEQEETDATIEESDTLSAMRVTLDEERQQEIDKLQKEMESKNITSEEKNNNYEQIKYLTELSSKEEDLENKIKKNFKITCFIKIDNDNISVTTNSKEDSPTLANNIMRAIQEEYDEQKYITVTFNS